MTKDQALAIYDALALQGLTQASDADAATALNAVLRERRVTAEQLVTAVGLTAGKRLLDALNTAAATNSAIAAAVAVLTNGGSLDLASPALQEAVAELVLAEAIQPTDAEAVASLARRYGTLSAAAVATARVVGQARDDYEAALVSARSTYDAAVATALSE